QLQPVKLIPEFLSIDDISKLWASWQAHARPALTYQVSMVLVGNYDEEHVAQGKTAEAVQ
ncbi:MAG TPA: Pvc16 family protein, partial [Ktedonobacteraceae bacterium]|nr:Pvc16 family protein [Ktedonobacteraceae bacterium]